MNLKNMSDQVLLERTENLVARERELLGEVLHHLKEIERRRLFSQLGYKSIFDYATKKLGYAEDQAARRISAMRLLKELPEIESKIADGSLTLTNLSMAQTLFRQESKRVSASMGDSGFSKDKKLEFLSKIENKSKREAEKVVIAHSSEPAKLSAERMRAVTDTHVEIKFIASNELQQKLSKIKGLLAHSHPSLSMAEAINLLCDIAIQNLDPAEKVKERVKKTGTTSKSPAPDIKRRITAGDRRQVWKRASSQCQNCGSTHALQIDHIQPKALGGSDEAHNLRLLCRPCNQRAAINSLGLTKMQRYLDRPADG